MSLASLDEVKAMMAGSSWRRTAWLDARGHQVDSRDQAEMVLVECKVGTGFKSLRMAVEDLPKLTDVQPWNGGHAH